MLKTQEQVVAELKAYVQAGASGGRTVCKKHQWACIRFLNDLKRDDIFFDEDELYGVYVWSYQFRHRLGILAGEPLDLNGFQLFILGSIFAWKRKATGLRRYQRAYVQVGRKNSKSQLLGCASSYEAVTNPEQSEVYLSGWNKDGSDIVYREIAFQLRSSTELTEDQHWKESYGQITFIHDNSFIKKLSREAKNNDNANAASLAIVDEYKDHDTSEIYDNLLSGQGSRKEPLIVIITTAGEDLNKPCYTEYGYVSDILNPDSDINADDYFVDIHEMEDGDDLDDSTLYVKANPIVATYPEGLDKLKQERQTSIDNPTKLRQFLTKRLNIWVQMRADGYMDLAKWKSCEDTKLSFEDFTGRDTAVGLDLSMKWDLSSVAYEALDDGGNVMVIHHSYMPEETYNMRLAERRYPWDTWVEQGYLTITPGAIVDYRYIINDIKANEEKYGFKVEYVCYDPYSATQTATTLSDDGYTTIEIRQGVRTLSEPTKHFRELVYTGNVRHQPDGLLSFAVGNAVLYADSNENVKLDKKKSKEKIDPVVAIINSHTQFLGASTVSTEEQLDDFLDTMGW